eukprot:SAG22_NODE_316_length_12517_cov_75.265180_10_plen_291_part_00
MVRAPCSQSSCCSSGYCDPNAEKCAKKTVTVTTNADEQGQAAAYACGPMEYCGMAMAGKLWPSLFSDGVEAAGRGGADASKPLVLSRNAWAGAAAHGVALWSSDIACSWTEFRAQVIVGMSSGLSGIPFWSSDVGGFGGLTTAELASRWHQFGSVCPLHRSHGSRPGNEPWTWGPKAEASISKSIRLRASLKDYVMELSANATKFGTPIMVPLWFYFDDSELQAREVTTEFMFGPKYLAAPVLEKGATTRSLYLPHEPGGWTHYHSRQKFSGGSNITVPAPFDELPLFFR